MAARHSHLQTSTGAHSLPISPAASPESSTAATAQTSPHPAQLAGSADTYGFGALTVYLFLSALFFGRALMGHLSDYHLGVDIPADSTIFI
jgi:hypothetical protein